jgi:hypothetical protein
LALLPLVRQRGRQGLLKNSKISGYTRRFHGWHHLKLAAHGSASAAVKVYATVAVNGSLKITSAVSRGVFRRTDITGVAC